MLRGGAARRDFAASGAGEARLGLEAGFALAKPGVFGRSKSCGCVVLSSWRVGAFAAGRCLFEDAGDAGEREPTNAPIRPLVGNSERERDADPDARAVKTIHGPTERAVTQQCAEFDQRVPRAIFRNEQMGNSPDCEAANRVVEEHERRGQFSLTTATDTDGQA